MPPTAPGRPHCGSHLHTSASKEPLVCRIHYRIYLEGSDVGKGEVYLSHGLPNDPHNRAPAREARREPNGDAVGRSGRCGS